MAAGSHLGSQLGCLPAEDGLAAGVSSTVARAHAVVVGVLTSAEILIAARRLAGVRSHLSAVAGIVHREDLRQLCRDELTGADVRVDGWDIRGRWFGVVVGATPRLVSARRSKPASNVELISVLRQSAVARAIPPSSLRIGG